MEFENTQNNALAKLPMLKLGEYEMWEIRIKQYFQIQDYALWEVIENGNSWVPIPVTTPPETGTSTTTKMTLPATIEEKTCKKNDVKRQESLMLQKLVSRLAILGVVTPPEDLNVKFLRSLPSEWDTHVVERLKKSAGASIDDKNLDILALVIATKMFQLYNKMGYFAGNAGVIGVKTTEIGIQESINKIEKQVRKNNDAPIIVDWVSDDEDEVESHVVKTDIPTAAKIEKPVRKPVRYAEMYRSQRPRGNQRNWNASPNQQRKGKSVNTGRPFSTARFNTGRPFRSTVNTVRATNGFNAVKPSACWSNSQLNDKGFVDSGCSRHMTGNIAHLSDFKDFDGGYVTFGGGAYGGRITGKGTIKTDNLDFHDVYFVKELKFNLFSVSQMCDKKNYVLFTDSECLVLSPNFKLPDENQILLKIPRQDNMYSFDMKNIVPKDSLTCLVAIAIS
ncbi:hypothetical protein Tco_0018733 [Tanacetum coccineum]